MNIHLKNIHQLLTIAEPGITFRKGKEMSELNCIENVEVLISNQKILFIGKKSDSEFQELYQKTKFDKIIDCSDRVVLPGWVDSHTHIIYAKSREQEFIQRVKGRSYEEIAQSGGGILNSAKAMELASEEQLLESALQRINEVSRTGTVAIEIKSGYGLSLESELKMLRVAQKLKSYTPLTIKTTLLGAHAIPLAYKENRNAYIELICKEMIPQVAEAKLADYVDVFCEKGFFTPEETEIILNTGQEYGLKGRVHANELAFSGGVQVGVKCNAISVDHLECVADDEIKSLLNSTTIPTILPATAFFLKIDYAPARKMIDSGLGISLASDFNPGTCPTGNLPLVGAIAVSQMRLTPEEMINALTINASKALELENTHGILSAGRPAHLIITRPMSHFYQIPYYFGSPVVDTVIIDGSIIHQ